MALQSDDSSYLNRGKILHGTSLKYDRENWSAQLVYLLDFLCDFSTKKWILSTSDSGIRVLKKELRRVGNNQVSTNNRSNPTG